MIIITADDYGKTPLTTDNILQCFYSGRITSTSAMVFMEDSERAATLALQTNMEVGLHLNFTMPFNADTVPPSLHERHGKVVSYLLRNKFSQVIYNPFLARSFDFLFKAQLEEFIRLYGQQPVFFNGHHHMHLCANILLSKTLPKGTLVRRTFTFGQGEKNLFNRLYRHMLDILVSGRFISTDSFFSISPVQNYERLQIIFNRAVRENVEIEVHPENTGEIDFLQSDKYRHLIDSSCMGNFQKLNDRS